ncbi:uncharacterized protein LOC121828750 [Peromyscus maniculatus bairdii]|uniref:uncharacterized protein LOC121828750 n=1 Tax=Peromyscus maniculatus bairdii TaxID=230844 RepID=UPI003FD0B48A
MWLQGRGRGLAADVLSAFTAEPPHAGPPPPRGTDRPPGPPGRPEPRRAASGQLRPWGRPASRQRWARRPLGFSAARRAAPRPSRATSGWAARAPVGPRAPVRPPAPRSSASVARQDRGRRGPAPPRFHLPLAVSGLLSLPESLKAARALFGVFPRGRASPPSPPPEGEAPPRSLPH